MKSIAFAKIFRAQNSVSSGEIESRRSFFFLSCRAQLDVSKISDGIWSTSGGKSSIKKHGGTNTPKMLPEALTGMGEFDSRGLARSKHRHWPSLVKGEIGVDEFKSSIKVFFYEVMVVTV